MTPLTAPSQAAYAYDVLAPYYDDFTAGYACERWIEAIEARSSYPEHADSFLVADMRARTQAAEASRSGGRRRPGADTACLPRPG